MAAHERERRTKLALAATGGCKLCPGCGKGWEQGVASKAKPDVPAENRCVCL